MKKSIILLLSLFLLLTVSCSKEKENKKAAESKNDEKTVAQISAEAKTAETVPPSAEEVPVVSDTTDPARPHEHDFKILSTTAPTCAANGLQVYSCTCGEKLEEILEIIPHEYVSQGCGNYSACKCCGAKGELSPHQFDKNTCSRCGELITAPIFVRNAQLNFDEPVDSITAKLGQPTEVLTEGDLKSYVYADKLSQLTVIQVDGVGLWGVFTMDPDAFFFLEEKIIKAAGFTGKQDNLSDTKYQELGSCRVYGFRDGLGTGNYYGLWLRYTECEYHYLVDPRITADYTSQSRLSFYYVNALRALNGMAPLAWSDKAAKVSYDYSNKMAAENFFNHDNLYGSRLSSAGILWRSCGENISQGYANAFFVCDAYYNCTDHRNNILSASFTHVGMGYALQKDGNFHITVLGTQTFYS